MSFRRFNFSEGNPLQNAGQNIKELEQQASELAMHIAAAREQAIFSLLIASIAEITPSQFLAMFMWVCRCTANPAKEATAVLDSIGLRVGLRKPNDAEAEQFGKDAQVYDLVYAPRNVHPRPDSILVNTLVFSAGKCCTVDAQGKIRTDINVACPADGVLFHPVNDFTTIEPWRQYLQAYAAAGCLSARYVLSRNSW